MKKNTLFAIVAVLMMVFAAGYYAFASDSLIAAGARLERVEAATVAAVGQPAVTIQGRFGYLMKLVRIIQKPATANNTAALSLKTRDGNTYSLYSLAAATHSEVRVDDLENQVYYADGATGVAAKATSPIWLREGETLSVQGSTNSATAYVFEFLVINPGSRR